MRDLSAPVNMTLTSVRNALDRVESRPAAPATHATQRQDEASTREQLTSANVRGDDEPIRSADVRAEVNKMGSSALLVIQVHGSKMATSEARVANGKILVN